MRIMSPYSNGILPDGIPLSISMEGAGIPATVTLKSAAAGRLIELSTDDGVEFFTPVLNNSTPTMQVLVIDSPVTHLRITGEAGDHWSVL